MIMINDDYDQNISDDDNIYINALLSIDENHHNGMQRVILSLLLMQPDKRDTKTIYIRIRLEKTDLQNTGMKCV